MLLLDGNADGSMKHITFDKLSRVALGDIGKSIATAVTREYYIPDAVYQIYPKHRGKQYETKAIHFTVAGWIPDFGYRVRFPGTGDNIYDNTYLVAEVKTNNSKLMRDQEKSMARIAHGKVTIREHYGELYNKYGNIRDDLTILHDPLPCCNQTDEKFQLFQSSQQITLHRLAEYKRLVESNPEGDMGTIPHYTKYLVIMCHVKAEKNQFTVKIGRVCSEDGKTISGLDHTREYTLCM